MNNSKIKKRGALVIGVITALIVLPLIKIVLLETVYYKDYSEAIISQQTGSSEITPLRGTIYDRNSKALAESASVSTLVCNPRKLADKQKNSGDNRNYADIIAKRLSEILDMDESKIYDNLTRSETSYRVIKRRLNLEETDAIKNLISAPKKGSDGTIESGNSDYQIFDCLTMTDDAKRYYNYGVASHILGYTGSENQGSTGIELVFNDELAGKPGSIISSRDLSGSKGAQYEDMTRPEKGADVILTIDETIQHFLEKNLEEAVSEYELKEGAAGIIMNPKTGEVYAMASKPDFDLNDKDNISRFVDLAVDLDENDKLKGYKSENEEERNAAIGEIRAKMWRNKAISDTYEPGSTFKIITAAEALEEDVVNENSSFYCAGFKVVADRTIKCHNTNGHGAQTFVEGVQNSCNPVFMELGLRIGSQKFLEYYKAFGYTQKTGIDLNGEANGIFYDKERLSDTDIATSAFGQGMSITPIQHISAISAVINGGNLMKPLIVKEIRDENGLVKSYQPEIRNKVISEETSQKMRGILESVVSSPHGSGKNAYIKGYRIGGKTGTSEKGRNNDKRIASFVGFAPADDPQIVCLIMMDEPQVAVRYGGTICAPVVAKVIEQTLEYMGIERQYTEAEAGSVAKTVPEVRGMDIASARAAINEAGFKVRLSNSTGGDNIVDQLPKPGVSLAEGSTVIIYTEEIDEERLVTVPDVSGMSVSSARSEMEDYGLNFEAVGAGLNSTSGAYAVKQSIAPGTRVQPATVVSVEFRHASSD